MLKNSKTKPMENKTIKEDINDYLVIILLGWIITMFAPILIAGEFNDKGLFFALLINSKILAVLFSLGLLILPIIFGLFAHKIDSLQKFWLAIFWLTLLMELILMAFLITFV